jgi:hypothetical protein
LRKLFMISFSLIILCINCEEQKIKDNILYIERLNAYLDLNNWHFSNDQQLIGRIKKVVKDTDQTGIIKANIDDFGIQFFLFENEFGTPAEFNTNINLIVHDLKKFPGIKSMKDFLAISVNELPIVLKNLKVTDTTIKNINGYECGIIEADYEQTIGYKNFPLSFYSMSILQDNKAYTFTGTTLQKLYDMKKPVFEKILFSINKK